MPSKNMLPKGKRRQTVKPLYREARTAEQDAAEDAVLAEAVPVAAVDDVEIAEPEFETEGDVRSFTADDAAKNMRLDAYLAKALPDVSRARVQLLIEQEKVRVNGKTEKAKFKLSGGERIEVIGDAKPAPLRAFAENIPLDIVFEDEHMAVVNKPAGMMVHAGSGATEDARNRGTLVNALLYHFQHDLSGVGGDLRPGIVHRLDKETSGLIMVAKDDKTHRALAQMFEEHSLEKKYIALIHGEVGRRARGNAERDRGTINLPIARDPVRRIRMTTRIRESWMTIDAPGSPALRHPEQEDLKPLKNYEARHAVSRYQVVERLSTAVGEFTLVEVTIETGRTHQIRVHMQAIGHPVVGDTLYGAPARIPGLQNPDPEAPTLARNFLHAASLRLEHPISGKPMHLEAPLPAELIGLLERLRKLGSR
ncbi:MAG: RluA family pseudouridine synthase [Acidobacteria bacterium]|nr:RluA family pseudouridine synthase [Acidobacteriota bacterium]